jgi:hypothetical protein
MIWNNKILIKIINKVNSQLGSVHLCIIESSKSGNSESKQHFMRSIIITSSGWLQFKMYMINKKYRWFLLLCVSGRSLQHCSTSYSGQGDRAKGPHYSWHMTSQTETSFQPPFVVATACKASLPIRRTRASRGSWNKCAGLTGGFDMRRAVCGTGFFDNHHNRNLNRRSIPCSLYEHQRHPIPSSRGAHIRAISHEIVGL